jgi:hypothetical protein
VSLISAANPTIGDEPSGYKVYATLSEIGYAETALFFDRFGVWPI